MEVSHSTFLPQFLFLGFVFSVLKLIVLNILGTKLLQVLDNLLFTYYYYSSSWLQYLCKTFGLSCYKTYHNLVLPSLKILTISPHLLVFACFSFLTSNQLQASEQRFTNKWPQVPGTCLTV
jgi:hypothetical protein